MSFSSSAWSPAHHEFWAALPTAPARPCLWPSHFTYTRVKKGALEITGSNPPSLTGKLRMSDVTAHVPMPVFFSDSVFMSGVAKAPEPCSHALSLGLAITCTLSRPLEICPQPQLQADSCLALTQTNVTTRVAALLADPACYSLIGGKGSSQQLPKSLPEKARCLWPILLLEPGNEISFGEYRIQGLEIPPSNPFRSLSIWARHRGFTVNTSLRFLQQCITVPLRESVWPAYISPFAFRCRISPSWSQKHLSS